LKHHSDPPPHEVDVCLAAQQIDAVDKDRAARGLLQTIQAAQERALSGPGWPYDEDQLLWNYGQIYSIESVERAEGFSQGTYFEYGERLFRHARSLGVTILMIAVDARRFS
jgi:hypothetical protein